MPLPEVTVLMPVYNCKSFVREAIESILDQTFTNFELIVIDDASTDGTAEIVQSYNDPRIVFIQKPQNTGYTRSLNTGLQMARGEFIARMDGDDISRPTRLDKQVAHFRSHPDVLLVGTLFRIIDGRKPRYSPLTHDAIKVYFLHHNYLQHPTAMMRREVVSKYNLRYNPAYEPAEDYKLWSEVICVGKVEVLNEVLLDYRMYGGQTSSTRSQEQEKQVDRIRLEMACRLLGKTPIDETTARLHLQLIKNETDKDLSLRKIDEWVKELLKANAEKGEFNQNELQVFLRNKQLDIIRNYYQHSSQHSVENIAYFVRNFKTLKSNIFAGHYFELAARILYRNSFRQLLPHKYLS
jgi:glycosyltransferase involved in cell wall biosynthesis